MARYSTEFKKNAVCLFRREGITKTCRQMHVTRATVYRWVKQEENDTGNNAQSDSEMIAEKENQCNRTTACTSTKK